jgi:predicted transposase YdaD
MPWQPPVQEDVTTLMVVKFAKVQQLVIEAMYIEEQPFVDNIRLGLINQTYF